MRIAVFGIGSIGVPIAARLVRSGFKPVLLTGNPLIAEAVNRDGLYVSGVSGVFRVPATAKALPTEHDGLFDVALLAMKSDRLADAVQEVLPRLAPDGFVVCLQNGVPEPRAEAIAGRARVAGGVVGWGASMEAPACSKVTSRGYITLGEPGGGPSPRLESLASVLRASGLPARVTTNLPGVRWSKLALNCTITTLGAVSGLTIGGMVRLWQYRELAFTVMSEVADVARAEGVRMEKVAGTFDISALYVPADGSSRLRLMFRHALLRAVGLKYRRQRSGITRSLERGRRPEIGALNGFVAARGAALGVPVPLNARLAQMVEELTAGRRQAKVDVWRELMPFVRGVTEPV